MLPTGLTVHETIRAKILSTPRPVIGNQPVAMICEHNTQEVTTASAVEGPVVPPPTVEQPTTRKKFTVQEKLAIAQSFMSRSGPVGERYFHICKEYECSETMVKDSVRDQKELQKHVNSGLGNLCRIRKPQKNL